MSLPTLNLELDAPITPGKGLGGLVLGTKISDMQHLLHGLGITRPGNFKLVAPFDARYFLASGEIVIAVDVRNGKIFMLSACNGYTGTLFEKITVGMKVKDAMCLVPDLYYDEVEEMIMCKGLSGVSIDISASDPSPDLVPNLFISAINVYVEETRTLQGQNGNW